jgi:hypothetical protein
MARTKRKGGWRSGVGSSLSQTLTYLHVDGSCFYSSMKPRPMMVSTLNAEHDSSVVTQICRSHTHFVSGIEKVGSPRSLQMYSVVDSVSLNVRCLSVVG